MLAIDRSILAAASLCIFSISFTLITGVSADPHAIASPGFQFDDTSVLIRRLVRGAGAATSGGAVDAHQSTGEDNNNYGDDVVTPLDFVGGDSDGSHSPDGEEQLTSSPGINLDTNGGDGGQIENPVDALRGEDSEEGQDPAVADGSNLPPPSGGGGDEDDDDDLGGGSTTTTSSTRTTTSSATTTTSGATSTTSFPTQTTLPADSDDSGAGRFSSPGALAMLGVVFAVAL